MADEEHTGAATIIETVVRTLRQVAEWMPMSGEELHETADMVERLGADGMPCPMCEEIECDEGCPLATVRKGSPR